MDVCAEPGERVIGGNIRDNAAQRGDGAFELRGIVVGAQNQIELGAKLADCLVVARQLLRGFQRMKHFTNFAQRSFDPGERLRIDAALAGVLDAAGQRADFVFDRFDGPPRHRLGDSLPNLRQFAAKGGNRLLDAVGTLQRFDLAGDFE